ncbi:MAG: EAL domain-containing protein [Nitrospirota bacterium]|nr:EAL domain-containing protein [Nitrospirota bacterium]
MRKRLQDSSDFDAFSKILDRLSRETDPSRLPAAALLELIRLTGADYGNWTEKNMSTGTFRILCEDSSRGNTGIPDLPETVESGKEEWPGIFFEDPVPRVLLHCPDSLKSRPALVGLEIRTLLGIPARTEGAVTAVISLGFVDPDSLANLPDISFFEPLAIPLGLLLQRNSLLTDTLETKSRLNAVTKLYKALSSINTLILKRPEESELFSESIRILIEMGGFFAAGFYFPDTRLHHLELKVYKITDPNAELDRYPLSFSIHPGARDRETSLAVQTYLTQTPMIENDLLKLYTERKAPQLENYKVLSFKSTANYPIYRGGHCCGVISFVSKEKGYFTADILDLLSETAKILSLTLDLLDNERKREESEERLSILIDHLPEAIFFKDGEGRWRTVNPTGLRLFNFTDRSEWFGKTDREMALAFPSISGLFQTCVASDEKAWASQTPVTGIEIFSGHDGAPLILELTKIPLFDANGSRKGLVISGQDITQKKKDAETRERYARIFENSSEGIMIAGPDLKILEVNQSFTRITGYAPEEVRGHTPAFLKSDQHKPDFYQSMWKKLAKEGHWEGEIWNRKKSGDIYCEWLSISLLKEDGKVTHYIGIFSDISDRKYSEQRIEFLASHDALTELPNRRVFRDQVEMALKQAGRTEGDACAVGILDLDRFKDVNDRLGHLAGDELLLQVAGRIRSALRKSDILARMGGDEFGLLLTGLNQDTLHLAIEKIMAAFDLPIDLRKGKKETVRISGSLGLTLFPPDQGQFESLLAHADMAMYRIKEMGGNGWALFEREMEDILNEQQRIRQEFSEAIKKNELSLHYQPKANLKTGRIEEVEALVRWNHPQRGLLLPPSFIDVIKQSDLIHTLGRWVLSNAVAQLLQWRESGLHLKVSVNIGAKHFLSNEFIPDLQTNLALLPFTPPGDPSGICLEITETEALTDPANFRNQIERCRKLGVRISLDDFGTGQASAKSLQILNIDEVKIDQAFIRKIMKNPRSLAIVSSLISVAQMLLIDVVAEGVETEEEWGILALIGCPIIQGAAISPPLPPEEIFLWISRWKSPLPVKKSVSPEKIWTREVFYLMIDHSLKDFTTRFFSELEQSEMEENKWTDRQRCSPCRWISYAGKLRDQAMKEGLGEVDTLHKAFHQLAEEVFLARKSGNQEALQSLGQALIRTGKTLETILQELMKATNP